MNFKPLAFLAILLNGVKSDGKFKASFQQIKKKLVHLWSDEYFSLLEIHLFYFIV